MNVKIRLCYPVIIEKILDYEMRCMAHALRLITCMNISSFNVQCFLETYFFFLITNTNTKITQQSKNIIIKTVILYINVQEI